MTATEERGPLAGVVDAWQQSLRDLDMGPDGLFRVELRCLRCDKVLNADGNHPAEVHAGTANGLCYACTSAGPYVEKIFTLDGALKVSWPPHCPSWRRTRETHYGYRDCPECHGRGATGHHGWGSAAKTCQPCYDRFFGNPLRKIPYDYNLKLAYAGQRAYTARLKAALGLPKRCSQKRYDAALPTIDPEVKEAIRQDILGRYRSLRARNEARVERSGALASRPPEPSEVTV